MKNWFVTNISSKFIFFQLHVVSLVTIFFMIGIILEHFGFTLAAMALSLTALFLLCRGSYKHVFLLIAFSCVIGSYTYNRHISYHRQIAAFYYKKIMLIGTIKNIEQTKNSRLPQKILLKTQYLLLNKKQLPLTHTFFIYGLPPSYQVGDIVRIENVVITPASSKSFELYTYKEGASATIFCRAHQTHIISRPVISCARYIHATKTNILNALSQTVNKHSEMLIKTIFFGNRAHENDEIKTAFKQWGISHYLARSGLHLVMLILLWQLFFSFMPIPFFLKELIIMWCVFVYSILSWSSISFTRALLIFICMKIAVFLRRPGHYVHLISVICLLVLAYNPLQLFFLDFQLSFSLTLAIAWLNHLQFLKEQQIT